MPAKPLAVLKQYWFFAGVVVVLAVGYFCYAPLARLSDWKLAQYPLKTWLITLTMVFTAFTLPIRNIGSGVRNWVGLLLLIGGGFVVYPLIATGLTRGGWWLTGTDTAPERLGEWAYGAGLILMAAVPTTLASGIIWTRQAGGDDALALVGMVLSLVASIFVTPLLLALTLFPLLKGSAESFDPDRVRDKLIFDLTFLILVPVAIGQGARLFKKLAQAGDKHRHQISVILQLIVLTTIGLSVAGQMAKSAERTGGEAVLPSPGVLGLILLSTLVIHCAVLVVGWYAARLTGRTRAVTIAVALNGAQKTLPVAILVESLLPGSPGPLDGAVWTFIIVHVTQLLLDAALIPKLRAWSEADPAAVPVAAGAAPAASAPTAELAAPSNGVLKGENP